MGPGAIYDSSGELPSRAAAAWILVSKVNVTNTGNNTVTINANTLSIGGTISSAGNSLTKLGAGTLLLYGNSTYSGGTIIGAGTLAITSTGGSITLNSPLHRHQRDFRPSSGLSATSHFARPQRQCNSDPRGFGFSCPQLPI